MNLREKTEVYDPEFTKMILESVELSKRKRKHDLNFLQSIPVLSTDVEHMKAPKWNGLKLDEVEWQEVKCMDLSTKEIPTNITRIIDQNGDVQFKGIEDSLMNFITDQIKLHHRQAFYVKFLRTGSFEMLTADVEWEINGFENELKSNPKKDVNRWIKEIRLKTGIAPNRALICESVYDFLIHHKTVDIDLHRVQNIELQRKMVAKIFGLDKIYTIGNVMKNDEPNKRMNCNSFLLYHESNDKNIIYEKNNNNFRYSTLIKLKVPDIFDLNNDYDFRMLRVENFPFESIAYRIEMKFGLAIVTRELGGLYKPEKC